MSPRGPESKIVICKVITARPKLGKIIFFLLLPQWKRPRLTILALVKRLHMKFCPEATAVTVNLWQKEQGMN